MKTLKIALGTTSEDKLNCLLEVADQIGIKVKIVPCKVESGVSEQPVTESETKEGSINRASNALASHKDADFALGIEVGYHLDGTGRYEIFCCTSIVDGKNYAGTCESSRFPLPDYHHNVLKEGKFLGHHVKNYKKSKKDKITTYVREFVRSRKHLISEAVRNSLLLYLNRHDYKLA